MSYATAATFVRDHGQAEAVSLLSDEQRLLTSTLLADAMAGAWSGTPTGAEQAAALDALARLNRALERASNVMDGYLAAVATLPLSASGATAGALEECCLALARYSLADDADNMTDLIQRVRDQWVSWLRDVSSGRVQIISDGGAAVSGTARVRSGQARSNVDWSGWGQPLPRRWGCR